MYIGKCKICRRLIVNAYVTHRLKHEDMGTYNEMYITLLIHGKDKKKSETERMGVI